MNDAPEAAQNVAEFLREKVAAFFGPDSPLREADKVGGRPYEARPQQLAMAQAVVESLATGEHYAIEAPTGVGKSFAYLIPAIYFAKQTGKPVVISTHTIALQEQLLQKDLPVLAQLMDVTFTAALAKGRDNYLCLHRLDNALNHQQLYLPYADQLSEFLRIRDWANTTRDGTLADLQPGPGPGVWGALCSEPGVCPRLKAADDGEKCFYRAARRRIFKADLVVANHAMLCTDLAVRRESQGEMSILPDYGAVILDEAHTFAEVASGHLGLKVGSYGISLVFSRLWNTRTNRGLLSGPDGNAARLACEEAWQRTSAFFEQVLQWVEEQPEGLVTYQQPGLLVNVCAEAWSNLITELRLLIGYNEDDDSDQNNEIRGLIERLVGARDQLSEFCDMTRADSVYWIERGGRQGRSLTFNVVPLAISETLRELLFAKEFPVIMTSATLAVNGNLTYFKNEIGAQTAQGLILDSPFDFTNKVDLYLPNRDKPMPNHERFLEYAIESIRYFVEQTHGKAFVLFTSYSMLSTAADQMADFFADKGIRLLVQGRDLQRTQMLKIFREDIDSVIFGTDSFWTGVDVPGEALSNVIIVKLPFPVPSHPFIRAKQDRLTASGRNAFRDYLLPEAVLKLRQGFGRLIRAQTDDGIVVILDPRILYSNYGNTFRMSLPKCREHRF